MEIFVNATKQSTIQLELKLDWCDWWHEWLNVVHCNVNVVMKWSVFSVCYRVYCYWLVNNNNLHNRQLVNGAWWIAGTLDIKYIYCVMEKKKRTESWSNQYRMNFYFLEKCRSFIEICNLYNSSRQLNDCAFMNETLAKNIHVYIRLFSFAQNFNWKRRRW